MIVSPWKPLEHIRAVSGVTVNDIQLIVISLAGKGPCFKKSWINPKRMRTGTAGPSTWCWRRPGKKLWCKQRATVLAQYNPLAVICEWLTEREIYYCCFNFWLRYGSIWVHFQSHRMMLMMFPWQGNDDDCLWFVCYCQALGDPEQGMALHLHNTVLLSGPDSTETATAAQIYLCCQAIYCNEIRVLFIW